MLTTSRFTFIGLTPNCVLRHVLSLKRTMPAQGCSSRPGNAPVSPWPGPAHAGLPIWSGPHHPEEGVDKRRGTWRAPTNRKLSAAVGLAPGKLDRGCVRRVFAAHEPEGARFFDIRWRRLTRSVLSE